MGKLHKGTYTCSYRSRWSNKTYRALSDDAKSVFEHILTTEFGSQFGLFKTGIAAMAEERDWELERYKAAVAEVVAVGWVEYDPVNRVWWIPEYPSRNPPNSNTVVISWGRAWTEMPDCDLKEKSWEVLRAAMAATSEKYEKMFHTSFIPTIVEPHGEPSGEPKISNKSDNLEPPSEANGEASGEPPLNSHSEFSLQCSEFKIQDSDKHKSAGAREQYLKDKEEKKRKDIKKDESDFALAYDAYPKKVKRPDAWKAWKQKATERPVLDVILAAIENQKSGQLGVEKRYIPAMGVWLRAAGWNDEVIKETVQETPADRDWRLQKEQAARRTREAEEEENQNGNEILRVQGRAAFHGGASEDEDVGRPPPALDGTPRRD